MVHLLGSFQNPGRGCEGTPGRGESRKGRPARAAPASLQAAARRRARERSSVRAGPHLPTHSIQGLKTAEIRSRFHSGIVFSLSHVSSPRKSRPHKKTAKDCGTDRKEPGITVFTFPIPSVTLKRMLRHLNGYLLLCFSIVKNHPIKKTVTCILDRDTRLSNCL